MLTLVSSLWNNRSSYHFESAQHGACRSTSEKIAKKNGHTSRSHLSPQDKRTAGTSHKLIPVTTHSTPAQQLNRSVKKMEPATQKHTEPTRTLGTLASLIGIAAIGILLFSPLVSAQPQTIETSLDAYPTQSQSMYTVRHSITEFPEYTKGAVHPGTWTLPYTMDDGEADFIKYQNIHPDYSQDEIRSKIAYWILPQYSIKIDDELMQAPPLDRIYLEELFDKYSPIKTKPITEMTAKELKNLLRNVHETVGQYGTRQGQSATWRTQRIVVFREGMDEINDFTQQQGKQDPELLKALGNLVKKLQTKSNSWVQQQKQLGKLSKHETEILNNYLFLPPDPEEIHKKLNAFLIELSKRLRRPHDPIELAAYAHMQIAAIHPFEDSNGRTARYFMNRILMQAGYSPVVILNNKGYTQAVTDDNNGISGAFACYLKKRVIDIEQQLLTTIFKNITRLEKTAKKNPEHRKELERLVLSISFGNSHTACDASELS